MRGESYWRLSGGVAAQFSCGISGFAEYQRLQSLRYMKYSDVVLGICVETTFR